MKLQFLGKRVEFTIPEGMQVDMETSEVSTKKVVLHFKKINTVPTKLEECAALWTVNSNGYVYRKDPNVNVPSYGVSTEKRAIEIKNFVNLIALRDEAWKRDGDWDPSNDAYLGKGSYSIFISGNELQKGWSRFPRMLAFRTSEIRDEFLEKHSELILKVKSLT